MEILPSRCCGLHWVSPWDWGGAATHHVDKRCQEHQGDGEHPNQGAVHLGPHDLPGEGLQRGREELWGGGMRDRTEFSRHSTNCHRTSPPSAIVSLQHQDNPRTLPESPPRVQAFSLTPLHYYSQANSSPDFALARSGSTQGAYG